MVSPRTRGQVLQILDWRLAIPALVASAAAVGGVVFGLSHDDIVTALGALLFVPSALLLLGIALKRRGWPFEVRSRRPD